MNIGFIGLGIMGAPMALRLAQAGHQLYVSNLGPVAAELLNLGAKVCPTPRLVTENADIIIIMVPKMSCLVWGGVPKPASMEKQSWI